MSNHKYEVSDNQPNVAKLAARMKRDKISGTARPVYGETNITSDYSGKTKTVTVIRAGIFNGENMIAIYSEVNGRITGGACTPRQAALMFKSGELRLIQ
jgi:hypothetical protein